MKRTKVIICGLSTLVMMGSPIYAKVDFLKPINHKVFELGKVVKLEPKTFLKKGTDDQILDNTKLSSKLLTDETRYEYDEQTKEVVSKDRDFLEVGKYKLTLKYKGEKEKIVFEVKDRVAPKFINFHKTVYVEEFAKVNFSEFFEAEDLSKVKISVDSSNVDLTQVGTYPMLVTATDLYGNKTEKLVEVVVVNTQEAEQTGRLTLNKLGRVAANEETREKIDKGETAIKEEPKDDPSNPDNTNEEGENETPGEQPNNPEEGTETNNGNEVSNPSNPVVTTHTYSYLEEHQNIADELLEKIQNYRSENDLVGLSYSQAMQANIQKQAHDNAVNKSSNFNDFNSSEYVFNDLKGFALNGDLEAIKNTLPSTWAPVSDDTTPSQDNVVVNDSNARNIAISVFSNTEVTETLTNGTVSSTTQSTTYYVVAATNHSEQPIVDSSPEVGVMTNN